MHIKLTYWRHVVYLYVIRREWHCEGFWQKYEHSLQPHFSRRSSWQVFHTIIWEKLFFFPSGRVTRYVSNPCRYGSLKEEVLMCVWQSLSPGAHLSGMDHFTLSPDKGNKTRRITVFWSVMLCRLMFSDVSVTQLQHRVQFCQNNEKCLHYISV